MKELIELCRLLNKAEIRYMVIGAYACALHGHNRATYDIDFLFEKSQENLQKLVIVLKRLYPHLANEISVDDILENIVLKIQDEPELDISIQAWDLSYDEALSDMQTRTIEGVEVKFLGIQSLIKSKRTMREQDQWDVKILIDIAKRKKQ